MALKVLVLTDNVPGHDRSSEGVLAALRRNGAIDVSWLAIREVRPRSRRLARLFAASTNPRRWLERGVTLQEHSQSEASRQLLSQWPNSADLVVSTGPSTAAANIAAARAYRARNIYCGFAKAPVLGFNLILSPVHSNSRHVAVTGRPTDVDATALPPPRSLAIDKERNVALLFGGESKHYRYTKADMTTLAQRLGALLDAAPQWRIDAYDSRRTNKDTFATFEKHFAQTDRITINRFSERGLGSNQAAFTADCVMVTADSLSMITEALASARPTLVIRADAYRGPARDRGELDRLASSGQITFATFSQIEIAALLATPTRPPVSQVAELAGLLRERGF